MLFQKKREPLSLRFKENAEAIQEYNAETLPRLLIITTMLMCVPLIISFFRQDIRESVPGYFAVMAGCLVLLGVFHSAKMKKHSLAGIYIMFTLVYALTLYLSLVTYPERYAASILSFFCVMPLLFVDKPLRQDGVIVLFFVIHLLLAYKIKGPEIAGVDASNCLISAFLGAVCGNATMNGRLDVFQARRQLTIEKETDVLTGIGNRRKLFETIGDIEIGKGAKPVGVFMLDVDHFKELNDHYGHAMGDECLRSFGTLMRAYEKRRRLRFFRYGGEEFVCLVYGCERDELAPLADELRIETQELKLGEEHFTVSIGVACCDDGSVSYEKWIERADNAAYRAKDNGRNNVVCWNAGMLASTTYSAPQRVAVV